MQYGVVNMSSMLFLTQICYCCCRVSPSRQLELLFQIYLSLLPASSPSMPLRYSVFPASIVACLSHKQCCLGTTIVRRLLFFIGVRICRVISSYSGQIGGQRGLSVGGAPPPSIIAVCCFVATGLEFGCVSRLGPIHSGSSCLPTSPF